MDQSNEPSLPTHILQEAAHTVGDTIVSGVEKVKEWYYGTDTGDLKTQIHDVTDILDRAGNQMVRLWNGADDRVRQGLDHIMDYKRTVQDFNIRMEKETGENGKPEELYKLKQEWEVEMKKMYENGLDDVKGALANLKPEEEDTGLTE